MTRLRRTDIATAAKFRATCHECNEHSEVRTAFHVARWMDTHEQQHRALDAVANGPLLDAG